MKERAIAVIGAGAAGIGAARCLAEAGRRVVVFEKSRGFGGRCATKRWEGQVIDHGAQYVTLRDAGFRERLEQACGGALCELASPVVIESGDPLITDQRWYHAAGNSRLVGDLADGLDVRLGCAVDQVEPDGGGWLVGGETFDHIISTAPVPQTRALARSTELGAGSGEGEVGSRQLAVGRGGEHGAGSLEQGVGSGTYVPCLTVLMLFAGEGLGRTREVYAISDRSGQPLLWTACENHKAGRITPGNTALVVQASRDFSEQHLEGDPDVWSAELGELACERWDIPHDRLRKCLAHRWLLARVETPAATIDLPRGWTYAGDGWGESRVESAWLAGWAAAEGLLQAG